MTDKSERCSRCGGPFVDGTIYFPLRPGVNRWTDMEWLCKDCADEDANPERKRRLQWVD